VREPLPGKSPEDPLLQSVIRYLNRPERTESEVQAKLMELQTYVQGHPDRQAELTEALKLFVYLMQESQAGRMTVSYGTPQTLAQVETFYRRLTGASVD
jgi:hypothetical protein